MIYLDWLQAVLESKMRAAPENNNRMNSEIQSEPDIQQVGRYIWKPWSSEFGDALGSGNKAYLEIHLEGVIEWT
jgi:hypothetical protein